MRPPRIALAMAAVAAAIVAAERAASSATLAPPQVSTDAGRRDASALEKQVRSALRATDPAAAEAALEELRRVSPTTRSMTDLQGLVRARRIAFDERRAVEAFLGGDYASAAATLESTRAAGPVPPRVTFYLACSRAALAATATADRDTALEAARSLYLQATGVPGFSPNWRHISPAIRNVLEGPAIRSGK